MGKRCVGVEGVAGDGASANVELAQAGLNGFALIAGIPFESENGSTRDRKSRGRGAGFSSAAGAQQGFPVDGDDISTPAQSVVRSNRV